MLHLGGSCKWYQVGCHVENLLQDAEKSLLRPIGEKLQDWERSHRDTIQQIGALAEDITREVAPDLITYGVTGQMPQKKPPAPAGAESGEGLPGWVLPVAAGGIVLLLLMG